jgi:hypothetical protein
MTVCSQIHTKHINTVRGQNVELLNVKLVVHIVTTGLLGHSVFSSHVRLLQITVFSQVFKQNFDITLPNINVSFTRRGKKNYCQMSVPVTEHKPINLTSI